jgi:AcrR family transcriptional regulator
VENESVKEQLIQATVKLLLETNDASKITARQIASESKANLGMINYYFTSKDALVHTAVNRLIEERGIQLKEIMNGDTPSKQKLIDFLIKLSDITIEYSQFTKATIPYTLLKREIEEPYYILPMIKDCFGDRKSETECRIIAYQLTSFSQVVFYRSTDFKKYTGIDIMDKVQRDALFHSLINIFGL